MDNRFPYDSQRDQSRQPPPVGSMNPLELEEALFLQRRQELQRDLQLRHMLLQDQIDRQKNMHQQRMYELQQQFAGQQAQQAMASLQHDEQVLQDQILRRRQLQQQMQHPQLNLQASIGSPIRRPVSVESMTVDSLTADATRRPSGNRKRSNSTHEKGDGRKRSRKDSFSTSAAAKTHSDAMLLAEASLENMNVDSVLHTTPMAHAQRYSPEITEEAQAIEGFQALSASKGRPPPTPTYEPEELGVRELFFTKGTIESLLVAGEAERQVDDAATVMVTLQDIGELSESEPEEVGIGSGHEDRENVVSINLPGFKSKLPQLPVEPEFEVKPPKKADDKKAPEKKADDEKTPEGKADDTDKEAAKDKETIKDNDKKASTAKKGSPEKDQEPTEAKENGEKVKPGETIHPTEYPYPVDTWWPSVATIRREHRMKGEDTDEENFVEEPGLFKEDSSFRADVRTIQSRLANDVQPGVLEKIPHCKIHRLKARTQKGGSIPDHAFCWQVTETYCNDIMVCCSICNTWRHAGCGGHCKPYSIRENVESKEPFVAICDLCHEEQALLQDFPRGEARLERQRIEQLRRGLSTSAVIRQASFVKHGGTYKWPLGSVSGTHIGGHTRSVHSRHDKAEKTWTEMTSRLGRGYGYRPKERVKVRTREFERLLVCVEDAEGLTERHNMIQFLENDIRKQYPAGYEKHLRNVFDPDDDDHQVQDEVVASAPSQESPEEETHQGQVGRRPPAALVSRLGDEEADSQADEKICTRRGCCKKPRFDSLFCSDSCGVMELERDLVRAMYIAGEMHPSLMRS